jgi:ABC-type Mn2+/Zn2+ transport system permease subunit
LGYLWLGLAGAALLVLRPDVAPFGYDLVLHAVVIGFVLSMVFGHALIILPAVTRLRVAYRPLMYVPLAVLHASLILRTFGDVLDWEAGRQWSGIVTILALVGFALCVATSARHKQRRGAPERVAHS